MVHTNFVFLSEVQKTLDFGVYPIQCFSWVLADVLVKLEGEKNTSATLSQSQTIPNSQHRARLTISPMIQIPQEYNNPRGP